MPMTAEDYQALIASDFGQSRDKNFIAAVTLKWGMVEEEFHPASPYLHFLLTKGEMLDTLLGGAWKLYQWSEKGVSESEGQVFDHLTEMRKDLDAKIAGANRRLRGGQAVSGTLAATAPIPAKPFTPDPMDRAYAGDPSKRYPGLTWREGDTCP